MYDYIKGVLVRLADTYAVVDVGGIGYKILTSSKSAQSAKTGDAVTFYTYLHVREDALDLYGFTSPEERSAFEMLISVSGVGPKAALSILSSLSAESLAFAIIANDAKSITTAQGVGPKLAQRIILELKDKINAKDFMSGGPQEGLSQAGLENEAAQALVVLGYSPAEAVRAVKTIEPGLPLEETIKRALQNLSGV